jgi:hypothetical protein
MIGARLRGSGLALTRHAGRRLGWSGLLGFIDAEDKKPAFGNEQANRTLVFVAAPFGRALDSSRFLGQLSFTQSLDDNPVMRGALGRQALRQGKK